MNSWLGVATMPKIYLGICSISRLGWNFALIAGAIHFFGSAPECFQDARHHPRRKQVNFGSA
jgi:hypothetical protein